jgi:2-polyprenyl-3-methyl-5-hydroxy-6-metoxy-1,4-benzoquinol methylase
MPTSWIDTLKRIPIDLGQGSVAETTEGKQIALRLVREGYGKRALDVGCRKGKQTIWLRSKGYTVIPIDVVSEFPDCQVVDANQPLPFPANYFDLVWCSEVVEHLKDPASSLDEFRRVTAPKGQIILTTPNSFALPFRLFSYVGLPPQRLQRSDHLHFFNIADIERLCPDAEVYGYFPYLVIKKTIRRWVGLLSPTFVIHIRKP